MYRFISKVREILYKDTVARFEPKFLIISDSIFGIRLGAGTNVYYKKYFDVISGEVPKYFHTPYEIYDSWFFYDA